MRFQLTALTTAVALLTAWDLTAQAHPETDLQSLEGTWLMESAYEIKPDGTRVTNYGDHPRGQMIVDASGRYSIQIFSPQRPSFASGDKARGTPDEYRLAVVGSSTHFGKVSFDRSRHQLIFDVEAASFPNWEGKRQIRNYTFKGGILRYAVPASASSSGIIAHSIWRRAEPRTDK